MSPPAATPVSVLPAPSAVQGCDIRALLSAILEGKVPRPATMDLRGVQLRCMDLRGANLAGWDLRGADLHGADLRDADLCQARLDRCNLGLANAEGALLIGASLKECILQEANLSQARLSHAHMHGADLSRVRAERALFDETELQGAQLDRAILVGSNFTGARLQGASLRGVDAADADFSEAVLDGASFRRADLRSARLRGVRGYRSADWINADLRDVDFSGAYLLRREAIDQNYLAEFQAGGPLNAAMYELWRLTSDCGRSVGRWGLTTLASMVLYSVVYSQLDIDYGDNQTAISPLYFSVITMTSLGYGDVLPRTALAQGVAMSQAVMGYVMLGGLLSIISNKMARRGD